MSEKKQNSFSYKIDGMHCASCEMIVKQELEKLPGVGSVKASTAEGRVTISYTGQQPTAKQINEKLASFGYTTAGQGMQATNQFLIAIPLALLIFAAFWVLQNLGNKVAAAAELNGAATYFFFGVAASLSSCAALVGGLVLSMSEHWNTASSRRAFPLIQFNLGRLVSYAALGGLLGLAGSSLAISPVLSALLVIAATLLMLFLGIQMTNVFPSLNKIQFKLPGGLPTRPKDFSPFLIGVGTFLIPCSFTLTAQAQALSSGGFLSGALILGSFALGTTPVLLLIGLSARHFTLNNKLRDLFLKTAGIVVVVFALFTLNNQLQLLGIDLRNILPSRQTKSIDYESRLAPVRQGVQRAKLTAVDMGYLEEDIVLRQGVPAELTIFGQTFGCANAVVARDFWAGAKLVQKGEIETVNFTPGQAGTFKGSCSMGMYPFTIHVLKI